MDFLKDKRLLYDNMVKRLEGGLTTLAKAEADTKVLSAELKVKNEEIAIKKTEVQKMIDDITEKSKVAGVK